VKIIKEGFDLRLVEIIDRIVEQGHLPDCKPPDVIKWSIENDLENNFKDYISAVREENLRARFFLFFLGSRAIALHCSHFILVSDLIIVLKF